MAGRSVRPRRRGVGTGSLRPAGPRERWATNSGRWTNPFRLRRAGVAGTSRGVEARYPLRGSLFLRPPTAALSCRRSARPRPPTEVLGPVPEPLLGPIVGNWPWGSPVATPWGPSRRLDLSRPSDPASVWRPRFRLALAAGFMHYACVKASTTITLSEEAYLRVKELKEPGNTFSDMVPPECARRRGLAENSGTASSFGLPPAGLAVRLRS